MLTGPHTGASGVSKHEKRHVLFMAGKLRFTEKGNRIEEGMSEDRNSGLAAKHCTPWARLNPYREW